VLHILQVEKTAMTIHDLLKKDGLTPKRVASTHGGEYESPCPGCGGKNRFRSWPTQGDGGTWWCRQCGKSGGSIIYLKEFHNMKYQDACTILDIKPVTRLSVVPQRIDHSVKKTIPGDAWQSMARELVERAENTLFHSDHGTEALAWLHFRGLQDKTIREAHLGYVPSEEWQTRESWGITDEPDKKIWIPRGIVIPCFDDQGQIKRIRFRREEGDPRYIVIAGGSSEPMVWDEEHIAVIIVESELCGLLLHQEAGTLVDVVALGNAQIRPTQAIDMKLRTSELILVSLDSDEAGKKRFWQWWNKKYRKAKYHPVLKHKDPTEMYQSGINLRTWIEAAFPWPGDQQETYEERSAILEYEGKLSREEAERGAFQYMVSQGAASS